MPAVDTLDEIKLATYLNAHVNDFQGPLQATKFAGGQSNPTFRISTTSKSYVLRRQPPGKLLKSAHAVDREYRVQEALQDTDVPVAKMYHLCEDAEVIGSMFYIMEHCDGNIYWDSALPEIDSNRQRSAMYSQMCKVLVAIHSVDLGAVGLSDYGNPGNYFERQYNRWSRQYKASEVEPIAEMEQLIQWLGSNLPEDDGRVSLVHGDYRLDNMMFSKDNSSVLAVLDWELSTLGHPFADIAYQCMALRQPPSAIKNSMSGLGGRDLSKLGIPSERGYVAQYCQLMGIERIENWHFYLAFSMFRLAAIVQGVYKRSLDGNASSKTAHNFAAMVQPLAAQALGIIAK